jgi:hypothetical protein
MMEFQLQDGTILTRVDSSGDIYVGLIKSSYQNQAFAGGAAIVPLIVRGAASQSADLQQWQNSAGVSVMYLTSAGRIYTAGITGPDGATSITPSNGRNLQLFSATTSVGGGTAVLGIANATTVPTSNPTGGGILYVESGALKYRGSSGTITTLGAA